MELVCKRWEITWPYGGWCKWILVGVLATEIESWIRRTYEFVIGSEKSIMHIEFQCRMVGRMKITPLA